jgi:hypothetical protein
VTNDKGWKNSISIDMGRRKLRILTDFFKSHSVLKKKEEK